MNARRMQALEKNPLFAPGATEHYLLLAKNRTRSSHTSSARSDVRYFEDSHESIFA